MKSLLKASALTALLLPSWSGASELVHQFENPSFGGNPLNSSHFMGIASAINNYKDPDYEEYVAPTDLERLASTLESQLISNLLYDLQDGKTGSVSTDQFTLNVVEGPNGLSVEINDKITGEQTAIDVSSLAN